MISTPRPMDQYSDNFTEMFLRSPSNKYAKMVPLGCTKWKSKLTTEKTFNKAQFQNTFIEMFLE